MSVNRILGAMAERAFDPKFLEGVYGLCQNRDQANTEVDYKTGMGKLEGILSKEQIKMLDEMEEAYEERRHYAAEYGFKCGVYGAFRQYFSSHPATDGGFQALVADGLLKQPRMQRHQTNYANVQLCNQIDKTITDTLSEENLEHMVSVACAWQQRVYSAAMDGFYCGYRAAYEIIQAIHPLGRIENIDKILTMEYHLGYIKSYSEVERLRDMAT